jgi:putative transposase
MIKTYKVKHNLDLTVELAKARKVAQFAIENRDKLSTKYVKHIGLTANFANQIMRKYGKNKKAKEAKSVPLIISGHHVTRAENRVWVPPLKVSIPLQPFVGKIKHIEFNKDYVHVHYEAETKELYEPERHIGVDMNTNGHCAVIAVKETGKVYKFGKKALHVHKKYVAMRKFFQKLDKYAVVKKIKSRESNIIKDLNHKISKKIIDIAVAQKGGVQLEKLQGISKRKAVKSYRNTLHSWSFHQLGKFIEYKAQLAGVPVAFVDPAYTSKACSRCGLIGNRNDKYFKCPNGHVEHADVNAAFNLAVISPSIARLQADRDAGKRRIGTRQRAT